ncbi:MAG: VTT domain-containing protein [Hydrotalea sp.]|nr:VTT domain-containing protein [Hydrotalea sp.]
MTVTEYVLSFLRDNPHILGLLLAIAVVILEDVTIIAAAVLSASGEISVPIAIISLFGGILIGEIFCYYLGRLAHRNSFLKKQMQRRGMSIAMKWLENNLIWAVLATRYVPGMRIAVYGAMGFYRLKIRVVMLTSLAVVFIWAGGLFFLIREFGVQYWEDLGPAHWVVVLVFILLLVLIYYGIQSRVRRVIDEKQKK